MEKDNSLADVIGGFPFRMAFAGGWIDQPFISRHNPSPPGSMVVVAIEPTNPFMGRSGMGTSTRRIAAALWGNTLPDRDPLDLVQELYEAENEGVAEPSGSQDMIGMIYPGVNRLDFDYAHQDGLYPVHIESNNDADVAHWLERSSTWSRLLHARRATIPWARKTSIRRGFSAWGNRERRATTRSSPKTR